MKHPPPQSALRGSALMFFWRSASRPLGLVREMLGAAYFGTGPAMDCYNLAFTLVTSLRQFFGEQFLHPILPAYFRRRQEAGDAAAVASLNYITTRLTLASLLVSLMLFAGAGIIVKAIAPGFTPEQLHLTAVMIRWFAAGGIAFMLHRYISGLYLCFFQYTVTAVAPILLNVVAITALLLFAHRSGAVSLAAGFALGYLCTYAVQYFFLPHRQEIAKFRWGQKDPGVRAYGIMLMPLFLAVCFEQVQLYVDRSLAAGLPSGSLSAQGYALRLIRMSSETWMATFGTVVFPVFASLAAAERREEMGRTFALAFQSALLFLFLAGAHFIALALPTVQLLFERGAFRHQDSILAANLLIYYSVAYIAQALMIVVVRALQAYADMKRPMLATIAAALLMIAMDFMLVGPLGIRGLALAMAIGYVFNLIIIYVLFAPRIPRRFTVSVLKIGLLGLILAFAVGWGMHALWNLLETHHWVGGFLSRLVGLLLIMGAGSLLFVALLRAFKVEALEFFLQKLKARRHKDKVPATTTEI